jgi:phenylacetate-CoA ligase
VNVFPSEIEAALLDDEAVGAQYAIVVDSRGTMRELEVRAELAAAAWEPRSDEVAGRLRERLAERLRLRVTVVLRPPGSIPRSEVGKARRVFERTADEDPFPA